MNVPEVSSKPFAQITTGFPASKCGAISLATARRNWEGTTSRIKIRVGKVFCPCGRLDGGIEGDAGKVDAVGVMGVDLGNLFRIPCN